MIGASGDKLTPSERRLSIIQVLYQRGQETTENLAQEFGVTSRTIRNDIDHLSHSYPIETIRGRYGGGVRIMQDERQRRTYFNSEEIAFLERIKGCLSNNDLGIVNGMIANFALN